MLTKAIILGKEPNSNQYTIRIPLLETSASREIYKTKATLCVDDGVLNPFNIDDVVYVSFEDDLYENPVILGKLSLEGLPDKERKDSNVSYLINSLQVSNKAELPKNTKIGDISYENLSSALRHIDNLDGGVVATQEHYSTSEQAVGTWIDGKTIYKKTFQFTSAITQSQYVEIGDIGSSVETVVKVEKIMRNSTEPYWFADSYINPYFIKVDTTGKVYVYSDQENWTAPELTVTVYYVTGGVIPPVVIDFVGTYNYMYGDIVFTSLVLNDDGTGTYTYGTDVISLTYTANANGITLTKVSGSVSSYDIFIDSITANSTAIVVEDDVCNTIKLMVRGRVSTSEQSFVRAS